ncbi:fumarylacetoacetate hydrolase family protein [Omnitrophica bacterium]|nr:fumarylacetoacetate hydrolase family protein [Candidatus Omnitrophota bacterium]
MKVTTRLINGVPTLAIGIGEQYYSVPSAIAAMKKRSPKLSAPVEAFGAPETAAENFLRSGYEQALERVETFMQAVLKKEGTEGGVDFQISAHEAFLPPIPDMPFYMGIIQNSPLFWRKFNRRILTNITKGYARSLGATAGHGEVLDLPPGNGSFRCAIELGVVVAKDMKNTPENKVMDHVYGYTVVNDMISNTWKEFADEMHPLNKPSRFEYLACSYFGRNSDDRAPIGPHIVTKDEVPDPNNLLMFSKFKGKIKDRAYSNSAIMGIDRVLHLLSQFITIPAGSVVNMGSMGIDGMTFPADVKLQPGEVMEMEIEHVGRLQNTFQDRRFDIQKEEGKTNAALLADLRK